MNANCQSSEIAAESNPTGLMWVFFVLGVGLGTPPPYGILGGMLGLLGIVALLAMRFSHRDGQREAGQSSPVAGAPAGTSQGSKHPDSREPEPQQDEKASLKVGQKRLAVSLVKSSRAGFDVWCDCHPGVETGTHAWILTANGWDEVEVAGIVRAGNGIQLRLRLCHPVGCWSLSVERALGVLSVRPALRAPLLWGGSLSVMVAAVVVPLVINGKSNEETIRGVAGAVQSSSGNSSGQGDAPEKDPEEPVVASAPAQKVEPAVDLPAKQPGEPAAEARARERMTAAFNQVLRGLDEAATEKLMTQWQAVPMPVGETVPYHRGTAPAVNQPAASKAVPQSEVGGEALAVFESGLRYFWRAEYKKATPLLRRAADLGPDDPAYHYFLAMSLLLSGQRIAAEQTLAKALQLESEHPAPDLGQLLQRVQGPLRRWLHRARSNAGVGPYRRRNG